MIFTEENRKFIEDKLIMMDVNFHSYSKKIVIFNQYGTYTVHKGEEIDWGWLEYSYWKWVSCWL